MTEGVAEGPSALLNGLGFAGGMMYTHHMSTHAKAAPRPCCCTTVRRTSRVLARVFDAALERSGMNVKQLAVLRAIERHEGEALTRVATDLCMDRTSLYRAIGTMERGGWVKTSDGPTARARTAHITALGLRALAAADRGWSKTQTAVVEGFGRERWSSLVKTLEELAACAEQAHGI